MTAALRFLGIAASVAALAACRSDLSARVSEGRIPAPSPAPAASEAPTPTAAAPVPSAPVPLEPPPPAGSTAPDALVVPPPAMKNGDFPLPAYCRAWVPLGEWADAYSNNGIPMRMRLVRTIERGPGRFRLMFEVQSLGADTVEAFLGHFSLIPLHGEGDSRPGTLGAALRDGRRGGVVLDFALDPGAQPALAFFEDDDFPVCFQVGPLEAGPPDGLHPLTRL